MQRGMVDTAQRSDSPQWEILPPGLAYPPRSRPVPAAAVCHISVGDRIAQAGEYAPDAPQAKPAPPPGSADVHILTI